MAFNTYAQGLKIASDLAQRAVFAESSLSSLPPLASPIPTLQKAFPLYISAAETYSHLSSSTLVPEADKAGIKRKWRLVLERAEKVKHRIEELGGQVGKVGVGDEGEEEAVRRRGGRMNGVELERWSVPSVRDFEKRSEGMFKAEYQPDFPDLPGDEVEWVETDEEGWELQIDPKERWVVHQGAGADCSVVAGLGVCLEHNRRWGTKLAMDNLYPRDASNQPKRSDNGRHILKLLLNGEWRSAVIDSLLPRSSLTHHPLHATSRTISSPDIRDSSQATTGPVWIPLALKAYFLAHGGYSLRGSNPAPDIYAFTGWIPERVSLQEGFQREKEWDRVYTAWERGEVLVTLGTGKETSASLIPLHAYAVLDIKTTDEERMLEIFDPGLPAGSTSSLVGDMTALNVENGQSTSRRTGLFTMTWDEVCTEFSALNLNWDPALCPVKSKRHWSWPKPDHATAIAASADHPRYRLSISSATPGTEVWILLSQHIISKDRALDDIALHVSEEHSTQTLLPPRQSMASPYSNAQHVLYRHTIRSPNTSLLITASRDRGVSRSDFMLRAFASSGSSISLDRISTSLPFSQTIPGALTSRSAGGHTGWSSYGSNPQYRIQIGDSSNSGRGGKKGEVRMQVIGEGDEPWNVKLLWSDGGLVHDVTDDSIVLDSGAYSYGVAFAQSPSIAGGTFTAIISTFEPGTTGKYTFTLESSLPVTFTPIPSEGAGLYHRSIEGKWTETNSGGRPSLNAYHLNPHIDLIIPSPLTLQCRLHHPGQSSNIPFNLTLFKRGEGGKIGDQVVTSGAYSDQTSGVRIGRTKPGVIWKGVYTMVPSTYEKGEGRGKGWKVDVWADGPFELDFGTR